MRIASSKQDMEEQKTKHSVISVILTPEGKTQVSAVISEEESEHIFSGKTFAENLSDAVQRLKDLGVAEKDIHFLASVHTIGGQLNETQTELLEKMEDASLSLEERVAAGVKPLGTNILCTVEKTTQTTGGIYTPSAHAAYCKWTRVLAVGDDVSLNINVGDIILIEEMSYKEYVFNGFRAGMLMESQVKAVISAELNVE